MPEALLAERAWLNVHPSLLPRWRGAAPVERAIMAGDAETGVTIHETVAELDAGPVAAQEAFPIGPEDDAGRVYAPWPRSRRGSSTASSPTRPRASRRRRVNRRTPRRSARPTGSSTSRARRGARPRRPGAEPAHRRARASSRAARDRLARAVGDDGTFEPLEVQPDGGRRMTVEAWRRGLR